MTSLLLLEPIFKSPMRTSNLSTLVLPIRNDIWSWRQNSIGFNLGRAPELLNFDEEEVLHVCNYPARYWGLHHSPRCFAGERESGNTK
jgi:hypothetical protein